MEGPGKQRRKPVQGKGKRGDRKVPVPDEARGPLRPAFKPAWGYLLPVGSLGVERAEKRDKVPAAGRGLAGKNG